GPMARVRQVVPAGHVRGRRLLDGPVPAVAARAGPAVRPALPGFVAGPPRGHARPGPGGGFLVGVELLVPGAPAGGTGIAPPARPWAACRTRVAGIPAQPKRLISWPPSRALRWHREAAAGVRGSSPGPAGSRPRDTATAPGAPYAAFGPAAAACHSRVCQRV